MPTKREQKKEVMQKYGTHAKDTGSAQVQVAILTDRINLLTGHLESHPKDVHSRKGLLKLVGKRRKNLNYLKYHKKDEYDKIVDDLKLRK
ncbi:MAG: 30S ribosomal protein S15 [Candidatus Gracilibacteria bacterium]|jgi:small subunit ribosomal protein S15|nr:30S ribosomal protein S15 [Candidatus Gracilibacteria bacterium]